MLIALLFTCSTAFSQENTTKGKLSTTKLVDVEIMDIQPSSKNKVTIVFRAETQEGEPAWDLKPEDMIVTENMDT